MFSLYVCDIPQNITKEELEKVFSQFNGFHEVRLAKDKNRQRIAFVDYDTPQAAEYAMSSTIGYRLSNSNKGISKFYYCSLRLAYLSIRAFNLYKLVHFVKTIN